MTTTPPPPKAKRNPIPTHLRPEIAGPENPLPPFPLRVSGPIIKGFGRGSSALGIPTANLPIKGLEIGGQVGLESGVYYGLAGVPRGCGEVAKEGSSKGEGNGEGEVYEMVMSVGWNPFYGNERRSVEVHILHKFPENFYGSPLKILILGFLRPEYDYGSLDELVADIHKDIEIAKNSLAREGYKSYKDDKWLRRFDDVELNIINGERGKSDSQ